MAAYTAAFYERNPAQQQARARVRHLLRAGYWTRQPCVVCGEIEGVEAHHDSYAPQHWELVRWLCKKHHEGWHQLLDPRKRVLLEGALSTAQGLRHQAAGYLGEVKALREEYRKVSDEASHLELSAWTKVMEAAEPLFQEFLKAAT